MVCYLIVIKFNIIYANNSITHNVDIYRYSANKYYCVKISVLATEIIAENRIGKASTLLFSCSSVDRQLINK